MNWRTSSDTERVKIKNHIREICVQYLESRALRAQEAMESAQLSANEETKSSMGDKYETGRAMAQRDRELYAVQASEARKELIYVLHLSTAIQ